MDKENTIDDDSNIGDLQRSFLMFKRKRQAALQQQPTYTRHPEEIKDLRIKFLQQVKKYLGVPYHRRQHGPDSPFYNAPLYLDCCGLVRRVCHDLKNELGFVLGPWNQGYQFDTLPIQYLTHKHLQPGDLVFISGTYIKPHPKKQVHDMVHVEVWLGEGEKTIGARWKKSVVEIHDSFKFVSKSYTDMKYYYCSIDTWLQGICRSFCPEHSWKRRPKKSASKRFCKEHPWKRKSSQFSPGRYSIFNDEDQEDEGQDQSAQGKSGQDQGQKSGSQNKHGKHGKKDHGKHNNKPSKEDRDRENRRRVELTSSASEVEEGSDISILFKTESDSVTSNRHLSSQTGTNRTCLTPSVVDICPFKDLTSARKSPRPTTSRKLGIGSIGYVPSILRCDQSSVAIGHLKPRKLPGYNTARRSQRNNPNFHYLSKSQSQDRPKHSPLHQNQHIHLDKPLRQQQTQLEIATHSPMKPPKCATKDAAKGTKVIRYSVLKSNGTKSTHEFKDVSSDSFISLWHNLGTWNRSESIPCNQNHLGYVRWQNKTLVKGCRPGLVKDRAAGGYISGNGYIGRLQSRV